MLRRLTVMTLALALAGSLGACKKEEGPMEKAGRKIDEAAEKVEDTAKDVKKDIEDAVDGDG